jgi:hypothetical protein
MQRNMIATHSVIVSSVFGIFLMGSMHVHADGFRTKVEYSNLHDSNFSRSNDDDESEAINMLSANANYSDTYSRQRFMLSMTFNSLAYDVNESLDSSYATGVFEWKGEFAESFLFDVDAKRDAYAVDPLEYKGKDIVARDEFAGKIGFGSRDALSFFVGGRKIDQDHGADERDGFNFEDESVFIEAIVKSAKGWEQTVTLSNGDRGYVDNVNDAGRSLDFDFRQYAYDARLKTENDSFFSLGAARFERSGELNSDAGTQFNGRMLWYFRPKLALKMGFQLNEPAIGEEADSLVRIETSTVGIHWQLSELWAVGSEYVYADETYSVNNGFSIREETLERFRPLTLTYLSERWLSAKLEFELYDRNSSDYFRTYNGEKINFTVSASF